MTKPYCDCCKSWHTEQEGHWLTPAMVAALRWLREHNGDGVFDNHGVVLAAGELAPFTRSTWNALRDRGFVEMYKPTGKGRGRLRLT